MRHRASLLVPSTFAVVLAVDVAVKMSVATSPYLQHRVGPPPLFETVLFASLLAVGAWRLPSVGCALILAGVVSNRVDSLDGLVQNPLTIEGGQGVLAFNLADVAIFAGALVVSCEVLLRVLRAEPEEGSA